MAETAQKKKVPTLFIEVYDKRESGFVRDDTEGTPYEERLTGPSRLNIPNESYRRRSDSGLEEIRYISGQDIISKQEQKKLGIEPHRSAKEDKIVIDNGSMTVADEGATKGLYVYLKDCMWNADNPQRSDNATPLFKVIDLDKAEEETNEYDLLQNEASAFVYSLQKKRGDVWHYDEQRINAICELFNVYAERMPTKIAALVGVARVAPKEFLNKVKIFEQTAATMVAHALQLNVIEIEGNTLRYKSKDKIIKNLGTGTIKKADQIEMFALFLRSADGNDAYHELSAEVEHAKNEKS